MNIVIPASGLGKRFKEVGYDVPKPFLEVNNYPMIVAVTKNVTPKYSHSNVYWLVRPEHSKQAAGLATAYNLSVGIIEVPGVTQGAACTVLLASEYIDNRDPLMIVNSDQIVDTSIDNFLECMDQAAGIMTFKSTEPRWSFARCNGKMVLEVAEKIPISDNATCGIYWYHHGDEFVEFAKEMIRKNIRTNGEFYVAPVFNEYILANKPIRTYEIEADQMHGLGTPEDYEKYVGVSQT